MKQNGVAGTYRQDYSGWMSGVFRVRTVCQIYPEGVLSD
jgi:hypothetical protein